jgi:pimeloyl-ACP methyl ester carboxylesterase
MLEIEKTSFVTISGRRMAYTEVCPPNPEGTVLLITGLASNRLSWYNQLEEFGQLYRTIAIDNRDAGDSDPSEGPYSVADMAGDTALFLKELNIEQAYVVGISMGGFIALELALRHPALVSKLVLVSTSGGGLTNVPANPRLWPTFLTLRSQNLEPADLVRRVFTLIMGPGYAAKHPETIREITTIAGYQPISPRGYSRQLRACLFHNAAFRLGQIKVPTLIIHGDKDPLVPIGNGRRLARKIPGAKMYVYPNTGHLPIIEEARRFNRDVLAFLAQT